MVKKLLPLFTIAIMALMLSACGRDWYGNMFVNRKDVTFHVLSDSGQPLQNVCVKSEELDAFDGDLIVDGTHYAYTDADGMVTLHAVYDEEEGYSRLGERTTRFTFTANDYVPFDTVFNYWTGTIEIILNEE